MLYVNKNGKRLKTHKKSKIASADLKNRFLQGSKRQLLDKLAEYMLTAVLGLFKGFKWGLMYFNADFVAIFILMANFLLFEAKNALLCFLVLKKNCKVVKGFFVPPKK